MAQEELQEAVVEMLERARHADTSLVDLVPSEPHAAAEVIEGLRKVAECQERIDGWVELLSSQPWEYYVHLTFKHPLDGAKADKRFREWVHELNRAAFGKRYYEGRNKKIYDGGFKWVRAAEFQHRKAIHYHAVLGSHVEHRDLSLDFCEELWAHDAKVEYYDPAKGGLAYIVKTAALAECEIDVSDNFRAAPPVKSH